jgi:hypothetical protein
MSRTTLVKTFVRSVRETLQDQDYALLRWPEIGLVELINYGQRALAKYLPSVGARVDAVKLPAGTKVDVALVAIASIIPGDGSAAADAYGLSINRVVRNMGANGSTPGRVIRQVELDAKDAANPNWHTEANSTVVHEWCAVKDSPRTFYVSPPCQGVWVELAWNVEPVRVPAGGAAGAEIYTTGGASTTLLGIPDANVDELHAYVVSMCLLKGGKNNVNIPKSQVWAGLFINSLNALAEAETGKNPKLKLLPFADEISAGA